MERVRLRPTPTLASSRAWSVEVEFRALAPQSLLDFETHDGSQPLSMSAPFSVPCALHELRSAHASRNSSDVFNFLGGCPQLQNDIPTHLAASVWACGAAFCWRSSVFIAAPCADIGRDHERGKATVKSLGRVPPAERRYELPLEQKPNLGTQVLVLQLSY